MDNQQERSLAWLAGIIDGEGSVSVQVYTLPNGRVRLTPFVGIVNSDIGILDECKRILKEIGAEFRICAKPLSTGKFTGSLRCENLRLDGMKPVKALLLVIGPYLRSVKRENAAVILRYLESRAINGFSRDAKGRVRRSEYSRAEIELVSTIRRHRRAKSSETICQAPNVI